MTRIVKPTKKPPIPRGKCSACYPRGIHYHLTGEELIRYISQFDRMNNFRSGSVYIINGEKVRI